MIDDESFLIRVINMSFPWKYEPRDSTLRKFCSFVLITFKI